MGGKKGYLARLRWKEHKHIITRLKAFWRVGDCLLPLHISGWESQTKRSWSAPGLSLHCQLCHPGLLAADSLPLSLQAQSFTTRPPVTLNMHSSEDVSTRPDAAENCGGVLCAQPVYLDSPGSPAHGWHCPRPTELFLITNQETASQTCLQADLMGSFCQMKLPVQMILTWVQLTKLINNGNNSLHHHRIFFSF